MSNLVSRQDAIDDLHCKDPSQIWDTADIEVWINELPSAEPEIIRCKDCRWWDKSEDSPFGYCMAMKHGYMTANWEIGIYRRYKGDFYCADAERRTDE